MFSFFHADRDSETATLDIRVNLFGVQIPVIGIETDMCKSALKCPLKKGETYKGTVVLPVHSFALVVSILELQFLSMPNCFVDIRKHGVIIIMCIVLFLPN